MTTLGDPRPLTNEELLDFEQTDRCQKSWYSKSLLLTIAAIRQEHFYELELVRRSSTNPIATQLVREHL